MRKTKKSVSYFDSLPKDVTVFLMAQRQMLGDVFVYDGVEYTINETLTMYIHIYSKTHSPESFVFLIPKPLKK